MTEHPGLETPGGLIREARKSQAVSLAEMSERTKIPPQVIEAIERDEYHKVSGALYIKSFLRTCAVEMGLDAEVVLGLYSSFSGEATSGRGGDATWTEPEVQISRIGLPWRTFAMVGVVLVVGGGAALMGLRGCGGEDQAVPEPEPKVEEAAPLSSTEVLAEKDSVVVVRPDTLAGNWASSKPPVKVSAPVKTETPAVKLVRDSPANLGEKQAVLPAPLPLVGGPSLVFKGGRKQAVVLRVISDRKLNVQVKRDAEQLFETAVWPIGDAAAQALPATGIEPGRVYRVSRGFVVYWGAGDHLSLRLDRTDGVEVSLNGNVRNITNLRPGGELLLDAHGN